MRLCLVVANQTLMGEELLQALLAKQEEGEVAFHVVVPATHPKGAWSEGSVHAEMGKRLEQARAHFAEDRVRRFLASHPEIHGDGFVSTRDDRFSEAELAIQLQGPCLHSKRAGGGSGLCRLVHDPHTHAPLHQPQAGME